MVSAPTPLAPHSLLGLMTIFGASPLDTWLGTHGYCTPSDGGPALEYLAGDVAPAAPDPPPIGAAAEEPHARPAECASAAYIYLECLWWGGGMLLGAPLVISPPQGPFDRHFSDPFNEHATLRQAEQVVILLLKTAGALLWTTVIARFVGVYNTLDPDARDFRTGWDALNRYIGHFGIDTQSAVALRTYYLERSEIVRQKSRARVVSDFSPLLLQGYTWRNNEKWLRRAPCFALIFEQVPMAGPSTLGSEQSAVAQRFLVQISLSMEPRVFVPRERPPARHLYIIVAGPQSTGTARYKDRLLRKGDSWGAEDVLLSGMPDTRRHRARAISHLHVLCMTSANIEALKLEFRGPYLLTKLWACIHAAGGYIIELHRHQKKVLVSRVGEGAGQMRPIELEHLLNLPSTDGRRVSTVRALREDGSRMLSSHGLQLYRLYFNIIDIEGYEIVKERGRQGLKRVLRTHRPSSPSSGKPFGAEPPPPPPPPPPQRFAEAQPVTARQDARGVAAVDAVALSTQVSVLSEQLGRLTTLVETLCKERPEHWSKTTTPAVAQNGMRTARDTGTGTANGTGVGGQGPRARTSGAPTRTACHRRSPSPTSSSPGRMVTPRAAARGATGPATVSYHL